MAVLLFGGRACYIEIGLWEPMVPDVGSWRIEVSQGSIEKPDSSCGSCSEDWLMYEDDCFY